MDLEIKYGNGSMIVHMNELLNCCNISKFRKLIKIIKQSESPDDVDLVKAYIEQEIEQFEPRQMEHEKHIIGYEEKVRYCQSQLERCINNRSKFKKNSTDWVQHNNYAKQYSQELQEIKFQLRFRKTDRDRCIKNKQFYTK